MPLGLISLWDTVGPTLIAQIDAAKAGAVLQAPVTLETDSVLTIENGGGALGARPYYFVQHRPFDVINQPETELNVDVASWTVLTAIPNAATGGNDFFVAGTLGA